MINPAKEGTTPAAFAPPGFSPTRSLAGTKNPPTNSDRDFANDHAEKRQLSRNHFG
jgi:hypothetical protein